MKGVFLLFAKRIIFFWCEPGANGQQRKTLKKNEKQVLVKRLVAKNAEKNSGEDKII